MTVDSKVPEQLNWQPLIGGLSQRVNLKSRFLVYYSAFVKPKQRHNSQHNAQVLIFCPREDVDTAHYKILSSQCNQHVAQSESF